MPLCQDTPPGFTSISSPSVQPLVLHEFTCLAYDQAEEEDGKGEANRCGIQDFALEFKDGKSAKPNVHSKLVGGFSPSWKILVKLGIFPK